MNNERLVLDLPKLSDGVSRQPESLRFPSQVDDAKNARFDVRNGASKRPGTMLVSEYGSTFQSSQVLGMHAIDRDDDEQYMVIYGRNTGGYMQIEVFDADGTAATINAAGAAYTPGSPSAGDQTDIENYLKANSSTASDLRLRTIIDSTFIVNKTVATASEATAAKTVVREFRNYEEMTRHTPADDTFHRTREDSAGGNAGYWKYDTGIGTFATYRMAAAGTNDWQTAAHWSGQRVGFRVGFLRWTNADTGLTFTNATKRLTKAGAFTDYVWSADDQVYVTGGTSVVTGWYRVVSKDSDDQITLDADIGGTNPSDVTIAGVGREYQVEVDYTGTAPASMQQVAGDLQEGLRAAGSKDGLIEWVPDAAKESTAGNGYFVITSDYRGPDASITAPTAPVTSTTRGITDLTASNNPFNSGTGTAGTGSVFIGSNDFFPVIDRWTRVSAPQQAGGAFDQSTMPVRLVRTNTSPLTFDLQLIDWTERLDGDSESNPIPTPITNGDMVSDIVFFEGRLALAIGEYMVFSKVDDLFNFFVEDINNLKDDDRISVPVGSTRVSKLKHVVPFRQTLILFTEDGQYELTGGNDGLSPTAISVTEATNYRVTDVEPVSFDSYVYFLAERERDTAVYEYQYSDLQASNFAQDVTAHVSGFLPKGLTGIASDSVQNSMVMCKRGESDVYVYRAFWNGTQKVQSAWCVYDFDDTYAVADVANLGGRMYILVQAGSNWRLEYLPMSDEDAPSGFQYAPRIDVRTTLTPTVSSGAGTFDLSSTGLFPEGSTLNTLVTQSGIVYTAGVNSTWEYGVTDGLGADEIRVTPTGSAADIEADPHILGRFYDFELTLSRPYVRDEQGRAKIHDRITLIDLYVDHVDSGKYTVAETSAARSNTKTTEYDPPNNAITSTLGSHRHVVMNDADDATIKIAARDPTPCTITKVSYVAESMPGGRRI